MTNPKPILTNLPLLCILCGSSLAADAFLVKDGQPNAEIVIAEKPTRM